MNNSSNKNVYEAISQKIKYKNEKIIEALNKTEFLEILGDQKEEELYLRKLIESLMGLDFYKDLSYVFTFKDLPQKFCFFLSTDLRGNYLLSFTGFKEFEGIACRYSVRENIFRLSLKNKEQVKLENEEFEEILIETGVKEVDEIEDYNNLKPISFVNKTTSKAKKLHKEMVSPMYQDDSI